MDSTHIAVTTLLSKIDELEIQKKAFEAEKKELERKIREAASQISDLKLAIEQLKNGSSASFQNATPQAKKEPPKKEIRSLVRSNHLNSYPFTGSIRDKLLFALHQKQRFLHSREIAESITENEPSEDVEKVLELISKQVARYKRNGVIVSITDETGRNTYYGLPEWLNENKTAKSGYEPSFTRLKNRKEVESKDLFSA